MDKIESKLKKGGRYKGFDVLDVVNLDDYSSKGIWLRHRATFLEVFHMLNKDEENLFAFSFATPPKDSSGVAHIIEHSVLCGSKSFPVKDVFIRLANQSVKTFLNAMTFSDKTVYPASSVSQKDYFNLMAVYGDAVFFPLLKKWTFAQEGHRLEIDESGNISIQGVVYNEMKGNYSSFENVAGDWAVRSVLPNTIYDLDSGGDPLEIPGLTYKQFKDFHRKYYSPSNCKVFLYGNIPTEEQLDFIQSHFLDRFESDSSFLPLANHVAETEINSPAAFAAPVVMERPGPATDNGEKGCTVTMTWFLGDSSDPVQYMESVLAAEILMGHDGSPLVNALLSSGLGEDVAPNCGIDGEMHWILMTTGLRGVKRGDSHKIESLVLSVLEKLCEQGVSQDDVNAALLSVDFSQREVRRSYGPYSIVLMRHCLRGWLYGKNPCCTLCYGEVFKEVQRRIADIPCYVQSLLRRLLLENKHRSLVSVYPDEEYLSKRIEQEQILAHKLLSKISLDKIRQANKSLALFQQKPDAKSKVSLIPHISPSELVVSVDRIHVERTVVGDGVPLFISEEATNGIVYFTLGFPVDVLLPTDYLLLPLFCSVVTNTGFGGMDWSACSARTALNTGGFGATLFTSSMQCNAKDALELCRNDFALGRDWIFFKMKMLKGQIPDAMGLLADCVMQPDFSDLKHIRDLFFELRNDFKSSVVPMGNDYASSRCSYGFTRSKAVDEIWNGLTQVLFIDDNVKNIDTLPCEFERILKTLLCAGAVIHVTADSSSMTAALEGAAWLAEKCKLCPPKNRNKAAEKKEPFVDLIVEVSNKFSEYGFKKDSSNEIVYTGTQVGFAAATFCSSACDTDESVYEKVLAHWLTNSVLWEQIRTIGGAYGAHVWNDGGEGLFLFSTYRDPKPLRSLEVFLSALCSATEYEMSKDDLEKIITGCYSKGVQPRSPMERGSTGFLRHLYGLTNEHREKRIEILLKTTLDDVRCVAKSVKEKADKSFCSAVIYGKNMEKIEKNTSNIISLPV